MECLKCGKETSNPKFCSRSCAASITNIGITRNGLPCDKKCRNCNILLKKNAYTFCSSSCESDFKFKEFIDRFKKGLIIHTKSQRKCLIHIHGNKCSDCGILPFWNDKILVLEVDHIDGNSDNNLPDNLRLLCPNCHSQTITSSRRDKKQTKRNLYLRKYKGYE